MKSGIQSLFVVDSGASWIRSLLQAMPPGVRIHGFRIYNAFSFPGGWRGQLQNVGQNEKVSETWDDTWVSIPGWHRAFELSSWLVARQVKKAMRRFGCPNAVLFTLPWYAKVAAQIDGPTKAYYAHDTFRFYNWNRQKVVELEGRMLRHCTVGFGVAHRVVDDLRELAGTPVHYLPMATSWNPEEPSPEGEKSAEQDLQPIPSPRVGCVGQISHAAYDWDLIEYLSESIAHAHFIFIGPRFQEKTGATRIDAVFSRPNVHWFGPKPHALLPAYLRRFDVCINPLCVNEHNHRRSPLRLFDYLTTDRPIVSTNIAEASTHIPHVSIADNNGEFVKLLAKALETKEIPDLEARRDHIRHNTWRERAGVLCANLGLGDVES